MHINGARVFFALKLTINSNLGNIPYTLSFFTGLYRLKNVYR